MHHNKIKTKIRLSAKNYDGKICRKSQLLKAALPVNDDLNLKSTDFSEEIPTNILFPEELNRYLRNQIRALTQENGSLRRSLEERESELQVYIDHQQKFSSSLPALAGTSRTSELATSKIVELSKRVRELTAEAEGHKSRLHATEAKLSLYVEREQIGDSLQHPNQRKEKSQEEGDKQEDQIRILTEKLNAANTKLCECRNQCQQLKQDVKIAQKALSSEIGENVSIQSLTSGNSNWRGRAQHIIALQQKVSDLQERLGEHSKHSIDKAGWENRAAATVKQIEKERRASQEQAERNLKDASAQLEEYRKKLDGSRARSKILEAEVASLKGRLATLLDKGSHDDQLIAALTGQLGLLERKARDHETIQEKHAEKFNKERQEMQQDLAREKSRSAELQTLLSQRDNRLDALEKQLLEDREIMAKNASYRLSRSNSMESVSSTRSTIYLAESSKFQNGMYDNHYQVLGMAAEAERVRLLELLAVSNRRLGEQKKKADDSEDCLRRERKKAARLETKLARLELDRLGTNKTGSYRTPKYFEKEAPIADEIKDKLELLQEEVYVLQTRLQSVMQEKEDDLKAYTNLLDETRRIFFEAKKEYNQKTSSQNQRSTGKSRNHPI